jgi:hypothetical protein
MAPRAAAPAVALPRGPAGAGAGGAAPALPPRSGAAAAALRKRAGTWYLSFN